MSEEQLRKELQASFKNRAILYYLIFDELRQEIDRDPVSKDVVGWVENGGARGLGWRQFRLADTIQS